MMTKTFQTSVTVLFVCFCTLSFGQVRLPVHARLSICQKVFEKPENTVSIQELKFEGKRSHSLGVGFGIDFGLTEIGKVEADWMIQSSMYLFSVPVRYSARMPKEIHGFDRDVAWDYERYFAGIEASIGILRQADISDNWHLRLGLGANIQDMYISPFKLQQSAIIVKDGVTQLAEVVGSVFDPFGFGGVQRQKQDLKFNAVYTIGLSTNLERNRELTFDLKVCSSAQRVVEPFNFLFGDSGNLLYKKSYVGVDIAYRFSINDGLSIMWVK